ncbi:MAG: 3-dehydroquinate synthase [Verrucomicrobiota bacterium]
MESLTVQLGERSYPIRIGFELFESLTEASHLNRQIRAGRRCAIVVDSTVRETHGRLIEEAFPGIPQFTVPAGEESKSLSQAEEVLEFLADNHLDRSSFVIAVGGGVVGDLAGFCAATYLRGVDYFQIPTTLLSMVDSSVGGKTGVNLVAGKNLVGAFLQPNGVAAWLPFLETLPEREFAAGMAEVIKYGILADEDLFHLLEKTGRLDARSPILESVVLRCCAIKARIVAEDETELAQEGGRALLNLGHTFGHAIEAVAAYKTYLHGEAISIGMILAAEFSARNGFLESSAVTRIRDLILANGLPSTLSAPLSVDDLLAAMGRDKKNREGKIRLVVIDEIGKARTQEIADSVLLEELWKEAGAQ